MVIHEMSHAVGIGHEHQRPDRDKYITVDMRYVAIHDQNTLKPNGAVTDLSYDYSVIST